MYLDLVFEYVGFFLFSIHYICFCCGELDENLCRLLIGAFCEYTNYANDIPHICKHTCVLSVVHNVHEKQGIVIFQSKVGDFVFKVYKYLFFFSKQSWFQVDIYTN